MNDEIKNTIEEVLNKLTISFNTIDIIEKDKRVVFMINTDEAGVIIGSGGVNLYSFNHIVKRIIDKKITNEIFFSFIIDVNNYQKNRDKDIKNKTIIIGDRVKSFRVSVEMEPMSSYERMIVHSTLTNDDNVETESVGIGRERRVVIKFKKN